MPDPLYGTVTIAGIPLTGLAEPNPLPVPVANNETETHVMRRGTTGAGLRCFEFKGSHVSYQDIETELPYLTPEQVAVLKTHFDNGTVFALVIENTTYQVKFATGGFVPVMYRDNFYTAFYAAKIKLHVLSQSYSGGS